MCLCVYKADSLRCSVFLSGSSICFNLPPLLLGVEALTFSVGGISEPCDLRSGPVLRHNLLIHTESHTHTCLHMQNYLSVVDEITENKLVKC